MMSTVIILNSGTGSRMGDLTADKPKCLVEINEKETILTRQISILQRYGLQEILITTGPFEEKIKKHLAGKFNEASISYVNNPSYETTNYIYSLLLAGDMVAKNSDQEIVLMHGDLVFEEKVLENLFSSGYENAVLVNPDLNLPEKDFKAEIKGGLVRKIAVDIFGPDCVFLIPIYKLAGKTFAAWLDEMNRFRENGRLKVYAEDALNNLLPALALHPVEFNNQFCMEIDDLEDLNTVKRYFNAIGER